MIGIFAKTLNSKYFKTFSKQTAKFNDNVQNQYLSSNQLIFKPNTQPYANYCLNNIPINTTPKLHVQDQLLNLQFQRCLNNLQMEREEYNGVQQTLNTTSGNKIIQLGLEDIESSQFQANNPSEDRLLCTKLNNINALCLNIFDGHGGNSLSDFCSKKIAEFIDAFVLKRLKDQSNQNSIQSIIKESITQAYKLIEQNFYEILETQMKSGNKDIIKVGTCALTVVIYQDKIIIANCGDSQSIIITQDQEGLCYFKANQQLSVNNVSQVKRIQQQFDGVDNQVLIKTKHNKTYLKGFLQPTKTIGDYYLKKQKLFNKISGQIGKYKGPYLDCIPQFNLLQIKLNFKYMIIASDGLWDFVTKKQVLQIVRSFQARIAEESQQFSLQDLNKTYIGKINQFTNQKLSEQFANQRLSETLRRFVLQKCAKKKGVSIQKLQSIQAGQKRNYCDDISIIVVNFSARKANVDIQFQ